MARILRAFPGHAPQVMRVGTDDVSQIKGSIAARVAARHSVAALRGADFEIELIREKAKRGVNMELGHATDRNER